MKSSGIMSLETVNRLIEHIFQDLEPSEHAAQLDIHFEKGSIQLVISQEQIQSIQITCSGTQKVLVASVDAQFGAQILFRDESTVPVLPDAVKDALNN